VKIPKSITVGKKQYDVKIIKKMMREGMMGSTNYKEKVIQVATHSNVYGTRFKKEEISDTFWHELTHAILKDMGSDLENNESFVSAFSKRLNNAILSARF